MQLLITKEDYLKASHLASRAAAQWLEEILTEEQSYKKPEGKRNRNSRRRTIMAGTRAVRTACRFAALWRKEYENHKSKT